MLSNLISRQLGIDCSVLMGANIANEVRTSHYFLGDNHEFVGNVRKVHINMDRYRNFSSMHHSYKVLRVSYLVTSLADKQTSKQV